MYVMSQVCFKIETSQLLLWNKETPFNMFKALVTGGGCGKKTTTTMLKLLCMKIHFQNCSGYVVWKVFIIFFNNFI